MLLMGRVKSYYLNNGDVCSHGNDWHSNCSDCDAEMAFDGTVNPNFKDFDWNTPIKDQPWYTPSTEVDLDRDVPNIVWEPEYMEER